jgi:hypothetical protein
MDKESKSNIPHIAQRFYWWVAGASMICAGIWVVFVHFDKKSTELDRYSQNPGSAPLEQQAASAGMPDTSPLIPSIADDRAPTQKSHDAPSLNCNRQNPLLECLWRQQQ